MILCLKPMNGYKKEILEYQQILSKGLPEVCDTHLVFMQDGAPCRRSLSTTQFLDKKKVCSLSEWLVQSPDLTIIKNIWVELKKGLSRYHPIPREDLWKVVEKEWYEIPNEYVIRSRRTLIGYHVQKRTKTHGSQT